MIYCVVVYCCYCENNLCCYESLFEIGWVVQVCVYNFDVMFFKVLCIGCCGILCYVVDVVLISFEESIDDRVVLVMCCIEYYCEFFQSYGY